MQVEELLGNELLAQLPYVPEFMPVTNNAIDSVHCSTCLAFMDYMFKNCCFSTHWKTTQKLIPFHRETPIDVFPTPGSE
jgi:hypothetical protein